MLFPSSFTFVCVLFSLRSLRRGAACFFPLPFGWTRSLLRPVFPMGKLKAKGVASHGAKLSLRSNFFFLPPSGRKRGLPFFLLESARSSPSFGGKGEGGRGASLLNFFLLESDPFLLESAGKGHHPKGLLRHPSRFQEGGREENQRPKGPSLLK
jgi:hypothetical protein